MDWTGWLRSPRILWLGAGFALAVTWLARRLTSRPRLTENVTVSESCLADPLLSIDTVKADGLAESRALMQVRSPQSVDASAKFQCDDLGGHLDAAEVHQELVPSTLPQDIWHSSHSPAAAIGNYVPDVALAARGTALEGTVQSVLPLPKRKPPVKEEGGIFAKGFLNKPKRKPVSTGEPAAGESVLAVSAGNSCSSTAPGTPEVRNTKQKLENQDEVEKSSSPVQREQAEGVSLFHQCRFREARDAFLRMRDAASAAGLGREEGQAYRLLANTLDKMNAAGSEIEEAFKKAMTIAHRQDDMELSFNVLTGMGSHAVKSGDLDVAEHLYLQSLALASRVLTSREEAVAEGNLAMCFAQSVSRRAECFSHFRKAIALHDRPGLDMHSVATLRANYASALNSDGKHEEAEAEYEKALVLAGAAMDRRVEVNILTNLANLYDDIVNKPEKARACRQALVALRQNQVTGSVAELLERLRHEDPIVRIPGPEDCAVCLEALDPEGQGSTPIVVLPCGHAYHKRCWTGYLNSGVDDRARCPQCRNPLSFCAE